MKPTSVLGTVAATTMTALIGSVASRESDSHWYRTLHKPSFQPSPATFPIVWTVLYADIAVVAAAAVDELTEQRDLGARRNYIVALGANLALNASWSWVFFRARRLVPATVVAALLAASSVDLVRRTAVAVPVAGVAMSPYALWTAFATVLSGRIAHLNR